MVLPPELAALREQFEMLYHGKYSSRVLQFLFERSEYTLEYVLPASCLTPASNAKRLQHLQHHQRLQRLQHP